MELLYKDYVDFDRFGSEDKRHLGGLRDKRIGYSFSTKKANRSSLLEIKEEI